MSAADVLGLLAAPDRLRVVAALVLGAETTEDVVARTGLPQREVLRALTRLEAGGLVAGAAEGWQFRCSALSEQARAAAGEDDSEDYAGADAKTSAVLRVFFKDGRLVSIPAVHSKRLVVLDHLARMFEPGRRYPEREVDAVLRAFHPDYAALRRYLVDEDFLTREAGVYWRSGGTVEL